MSLMENMAAHRRGQGRPLGAILEWIYSAELPNINNQTDLVRMWQRYDGREPLYEKPTKHQRRERRTEFRLLEGGMEFEVNLGERLQHSSESVSEPDDIPL